MRKSARDRRRLFIIIIIRVDDATDSVKCSAALERGKVCVYFHADRLFFHLVAPPTEYHLRAGSFTPPPPLIPRLCVIYAREKCPEFKIIAVPHVLRQCCRRRSYDVIGYPTYSRCSCRSTTSRCRDVEEKISGASGGVSDDVFLFFKLLE